MHLKNVRKKITTKCADTINQVPTVTEVHLDNSVCVWRIWFRCLEI